MFSTLANPVGGEIVILIQKAVVRNRAAIYDAIWTLFVFILLSVTKKRSYVPFPKNNIYMSDDITHVELLRLRLKCMYIISYCECCAEVCPEIILEF